MLFHNFGPLQYPYSVLFNFHTSSSFTPAAHDLSGFGGSANKSWSKSACRNAVCASIETVMLFDSGSLFLSCELAVSIVSETLLTVLVKTSRARHAPDIGCNLSGLKLISLLHFSDDPPIVFESSLCQLLQTLLQLSSYPFLAKSSTLSAFSSSFPRNHQKQSTLAFHCLRSNSPLACSCLMQSCSQRLNVQ